MVEFEIFKEEKPPVIEFSLKNKKDAVKLIKHINNREIQNRFRLVSFHDLLKVTFSIDECIGVANSKIALSDDIPLDIKQAFIHDTWRKLFFNEKIRIQYYKENEPLKSKLQDTNPLAGYTIDKRTDKEAVVKEAIKLNRITEEIFVNILRVKFLNKINGYVLLIVENPTKYEKKNL